MNMYKKCTLYKIENMKTGDVYIGSTKVRVERRWQNHQSDLRCGRHPNTLMQEHAKTFGLDVFEFSKICSCTPAEKSRMEFRLIRKFDATYNIKMSGGKARSH